MITDCVMSIVGHKDEESTSDEDSAMEDDQEDDKESEDEEELPEEDVNEVFRKQLMDALHAGKAMVS